MSISMLLSMMRREQKETRQEISDASGAQPRLAVSSGGEDGFVDIGGGISSIDVDLGGGDRGAAAALPTLRTPNGGSCCGDGGGSGCGDGGVVTKAHAAAVERVVQARSTALWQAFALRASDLRCARCAVRARLHAIALAAFLASKREKHIRSRLEDSEAHCDWVSTDKARLRVDLRCRRLSHEAESSPPCSLASICSSLCACLPFRP
eukprot:4934219-Pleurochrysis_carterae.AAC.1